MKHTEAAFLLKLIWCLDREKIKKESEMEKSRWIYEQSLICFINWMNEYKTELIQLYLYSFRSYNKLQYK